MLDEPEHRVGEDVVEAVEGFGFAVNQSHLILAAERRFDAERVAIGFARPQDVAVGHCAGNPNRLAV